MKKILFFFFTSLTLAYSNRAYCQSAPYSNSQNGLPGKLQMENYDLGGEGVAYHETSSGNLGSFYRNEDVDIENTNENNGGFNIGWTDAGEWLKYTVNVNTAGSYDFLFLYSTPLQNQILGFEIDNIAYSKIIKTNSTGGWQNWQTLPIRDISLTAGKHVIKLIFETGGINLDYCEIIASGLTLPFNGKPLELPGKLEIENYDFGVQGVAYNDSTLGNTGGFYRTGDVDIETSDDGEGAVNVGWTKPGEYLIYTVEVDNEGLYDFKLRVATPFEGKSIHFEVNGVPITSSIVIPTTRGYQDWQTFNVSGVHLDAGIQSFKIFMETGNINLNYIDVIKHGIIAPFTGSPIAFPGILEFENYDLGGEGNSYHKTSAGNEGNVYRNDDVDIETTTDVKGLYNVGWTNAGEWMTYSILTKGDTHTFKLRYATPLQFMSFHLEIDNIDLTGSLTLAATASWQDWQTFTIPKLYIKDGSHNLKIVLETGGINLNYMEESLPANEEIFKSLYTVVNTNISGLGSLQAAIDSANSNIDRSKIVFNISGNNPKVILSNGDLNITTPVFIDGTSQPGYNKSSKNPVIQIKNVENYAWTNIHLFGNSKGSEIKGLYLTNSWLYGIWVQSDSVTIKDNVINHLRYRSDYYTGISCILFEEAGSFSKVYGNVFGTDSTSIEKKIYHPDSSTVGIYIYATANSGLVQNIKIGGVNNGESNLFSYLYDGVVLSGDHSVKNISISKNIFKNIDDAAVYLFPGANLNSAGTSSKPAPVISSRSGSVLFGTGENGDNIDLYLSNEKGIDAVKYLGNAIVSNGSWSFNLNNSLDGIPTAPFKIIAVATETAGTSSAFSNFYNYNNPQVDGRFGIDEQNNSSELWNATLYPNPSIGTVKLFIDNYNIKTVQVEIFDNSGKTVYNKLNVVNSEIQLDENLRSGFYTVKISTVSNTKVLKLIVQ